MDKTTALASEAIPSHLQAHARRIREAGWLTLHAVCKLGQRLSEAREAAQHGEWLPFLAALGIPETSARRYMKVAARLAERPDAEREPLTTIRRRCWKARRWRAARTASGKSATWRIWPRRQRRPMWSMRS